MTSHDTAGGDAAPHTTHPATKVSNAVSITSAPASQTLLSLLLRDGFSRGISCAWNALGAAVST